jgi:putative sterol carrier protein
MSEGDDRLLVEPDEYARLVRTASDDDLRNGLRVNGDLILTQIFQTMPSRLKQAAVVGVSLVVDWTIQDAGEPGEMRWQVAIADQACQVERDGQREPDVLFTIGALDFVKLITGNAKGPALFLLGRLKIRGDLLKAARVQGYFQTPNPDVHKGGAASG